MNEERDTEQWCPPDCRGGCFYSGSSVTVLYCPRYDERRAYFDIPKRIRYEDRALAAIINGDAT
jgi:hypothetical protein